MHWIGGARFLPSFLAFGKKLVVDWDFLAQEWVLSMQTNTGIENLICGSYLMESGIIDVEDVENPSSIR